MPFARKIVGTLGTIFKFSNPLYDKLNPEDFENDAQEFEFYRKSISPNIFQYDLSPKNHAPDTTKLIN